MDLTAAGRYFYSITSVMKKTLLLLLALASFGFYGRAQDYQFYFAKAKEAFKAKDNPAFYAAIAEAHRLHPYHQVVLYYHGIASALNDKPDEAITFLRKAVLINADFDLSLPELSGLKALPGFSALLSLQTELATPLIHSAPAFRLTDRQLHTEGIAFDSTSQTFFLGSIHKRKIVAVDRHGKAKDFTAPASDGMTAVFGLKVDPRQRFLWACSSPMPEMENYDSTQASRLFQFDLRSGKLLATYSSPEVRNSIFGDLALDSSGNPFVSDSRNNIIFTVNPSDKTLRKFFESNDFWNIQGITFSDDGRHLFIADYIKGIFRLDLKTLALAPVACKPEVALKGIDGLTYYKHSLIAVQNGVNPLRVMRFYLNDADTEIVRSEVVDRKHPDFNEPTLGTIVNDAFYCIANSQWGGYENGKIKPAEQLQDIVILKARLD